MLTLHIKRQHLLYLAHTMDISWQEHKIKSLIITMSTIKVSHTWYVERELLHKLFTRWRRLPPGSRWSGRVGNFGTPGVLSFCHPSTAAPTLTARTTHLVLQPPWTTILRYFTCTPSGGIGEHLCQLRIILLLVIDVFIITIISGRFISYFKK